MFFFLFMLLCYTIAATHFRNEHFLPCSNGSQARRWYAVNKLQRQRATDNTIPTKKVNELWKFWTCVKSHPPNALLLFASARSTVTAIADFCCTGHEKFYSLIYSVDGCWDAGHFCLGIGLAQLKWIICLLLVFHNSHRVWH